MKLLIASDIHGSAYYADKLKEIVKKENPDKLVLLGDLYYHGPRNPLPKDYNPKKVCEILNSMKEIILCVKGNCDAEVDEMISKFKFEDEIEMVLDNKVVIFTHGQKYNMNNLPKKNFDVLVYGHFHTGFIQTEDGILFLNPGSISLPKENTKNSYIIWEKNKILLKDLEDNIIDKKIL